MRKILKLIIINFLVLLTLILFLDFFALIALEVKKEFFPREKEHFYNSSGYLKSQLPTYTNVDWAETHFKEIQSLTSSYKSYYGWRRDPFKGLTINIDSIGNRKTCNNNKESADIIILLGGSTMWGTGANDCNTIPSLFGLSTGEKYRLFNYAESGYSAYQSLQFFQLQILKEQICPHLVVTYDGVNNDLGGRKSFEHNRSDFFDDKIKGSSQSPNLISFRSEFLRSTRRLISMVVKKGIRTQKKVRPIIADSQHRLAAIELLESWLTLKNLCAKMDAKLVCILQPNIYTGEANITHLPERLLYKEKKVSLLYYHSVLELLDTKKYRSLKSHFLDFTGIFNIEKQVYIDYCHVSPEGNKIIADRLAQELSLLNM